MLPFSVIVKLTLRRAEIYNKCRYIYIYIYIYIMIYVLICEVYVSVCGYVSVYMCHVLICEVYVYVCGLYIP